MLYSIIAAQMVFTQYGTYYLYSWDIMEPLCCLFGILDMNLAYLYWLLHGQEFCFETFEKEFLKEKLQKSLKTLTFEEQYDDTLDMIEHLESWKNLYS